MRNITSLAGAMVLAAAAASAQPAAPPPGPLNTATLANLCAAPDGEGELATAQGFCRGFMIGAWQYHTEISGRGGLTPIFCLANPAPTLAQAQAAFVAWAGANTQYANDKALDGLLRWAATAYPCPAPTRAGARR
jgi:hypothetical protein